MKEECDNFESHLTKVKNNGNYIKSVPGEYLNREMYLAAVKQDGLALEFVPIEMRTNEICLEAVRQNGYALKLIPEKYRSFELCLAAVLRNPLILEDVPDEQKNPEICLAAVRGNAKALEFVPYYKRTEELRRLAIQDSQSNNFTFTPSQENSSGQYILAVQKNVEKFQTAINVINHNIGVICFFDNINVNFGYSVLLFNDKNYTMSYKFSVDFNAEKDLAENEHIILMQNAAEKKIASCLNAVLDKLGEVLSKVKK